MLNKQRLTRDSNLLQAPDQDGSDESETCSEFVYECFVFAQVPAQHQLSLFLVVTVNLFSQ